MDVDGFLAEEHAAWGVFQGTFLRVPMEHWNTPGATGDWTPQDVLAHVAGWHRHCAELLATYARGIDPRKPFTTERIDEMNAEFVARYRGWDVNSIRMLSRDEHVRVVVGIRAAAFRGFDETWESVIRANTTAHYEEHLPMLETFIKEHA